MMKRLLFPFLLVFSFHSLSGQNFSGQWKGRFVDKSTSFMNWGGDQCDYTLELEISGTKVSGYSYTYFSDGTLKYYTICRLKGFFDPNKKYIEVTETERTKTNVPVNIHNCFQVHKLSYSKKDGLELLQGSWSPAPGQDGDCGHGITSLRRRVLKDIFQGFKVSAAKKNTVNPPKTNTAAAKKTNPVTAGSTPDITKKETLVVHKQQEKNLAVKKDSAKKTMPQQVTKLGKPSISVSGRFEKRSNNLIKTITVEHMQVKVDLYDNGEIDGDTVSVFFNDKLVIAHKKLTAHALTLHLDIDAGNNTVNELVMYAENLGTIPPNTALMVVTDGDKRYEVRISSDLQKSGTIRFVHHPAGTGKLK